MHSCIGCVHRCTRIYSCLPHLNRSTSLFTASLWRWQECGCVILCVCLCETHIIIWFLKHHFLCLPWRHFDEFFLQGKKKTPKKLYHTWVRAKAQGNKQPFSIASISTPQTTPSWWMTGGQENNFFALRLQWLTHPKIHQTPQVFHQTYWSAPQQYESMNNPFKKYPKMSTLMYFYSSVPTSCTKQ